MQPTKPVVGSIFIVLTRVYDTHIIFKQVTAKVTYAVESLEEKDLIPKEVTNISPMKQSGKEINEIISAVKKELDVYPLVSIQNTKTFMLMTKHAEDSGGCYKYEKDCVFINKEYAQSLTALNLEWLIFHEFGHAKYARSFAKASFFPLLAYENVSQQFIANVVRHMWNGICDYFVNELIFQRRGLEKYDSTTERTVDTLPQTLATGMCFHLFDYWKHGHDKIVAQKARDKIPPDVLGIVQSSLSMATDDPVKELLNSFKSLLEFIWPLSVSTEKMQDKIKLPDFWGYDSTLLSVIKITPKVENSVNPTSCDN